MNYTLIKINENETIMDVTDGAVMLTKVYELAKKVSRKNKIKCLRVQHNGVYLIDYFKDIDEFSIAKEIEKQ